MSHADDVDAKVRFLRTLAFEIRRKRPALEAMAGCIEKERQHSRERRLRLASAALEAEGFVASLLVAELVGDEAAAVLAAVLAAADHRLLASALEGLAGYHAQASELR